MEVQIKRQAEKPFFDRQEYTLTVKDNLTPDYAKLKSAVAKKLNVGEELVVIKKVEQQFGKRQISLAIYVYNSVDSLKKYEPVKAEKKGGQAAEAAAK